MTYQSGTATIEPINHKGLDPIGFRDPTRLTRWLKVLLWVSLAVAVLSAVSNLLQFALLSEIQRGVQVSPETAESNDLRQRSIGGITVIVNIITVVIFGMWIYRANYNARQLGAVGMEFTPGWAVGWYFIPFFNLFKPYRAMKEIWRASANPSNWHEQARGTILPWWWFFFLAAGIANNMSFRLTLSAKSVSQYVAASVADVVGEVLSIVSILVALALVNQIYRMQMARRAGAVF